MPDVTKRKVGIITCSGEEIAEGTVTRLAALKVLESLRPHQTVTICLPLFLAGGTGDRAFARFHPTIAVDGCEKRCAAVSTERYSGKPTVSIVVNGGSAAGPAHLGSGRRLSQEGMNVVNDVADQIARHVDELLGHSRIRYADLLIDSPEAGEEPEARQGTCSCGSAVPVTTLQLAGRKVTFVALPLIFAQFREAGKLPDQVTRAELMEAVRIYNHIANEEAASCADLILQEYRAYCERNP